MVPAAVAAAEAAEEVQNGATGGNGNLPPASQAQSPARPKSSYKQKSKRTRTAYSQKQQDQLEIAYHANAYPDAHFRQRVSEVTGIPQDRIQVCACTCSN